MHWAARVGLHEVITQLLSVTTGAMAMLLARNWKKKTALDVAGRLFQQTKERELMDPKSRIPNGAYEQTVWLVAGSEVAVVGSGL